MKFCWRITKYDPQHRNSQGVFLQDEWTSYSDIGKTFGNIKFNYTEYLRIENVYISAIQSLMKCHDVPSLQITSLEKSKTLKKDLHNTDNMITLFNNVKENDWVQQNDIEDFCKLILREKLWCKLRFNQKMFVHFGWDFYMYIGSSLPCNNAIIAVQKSGLFVENFASPYQK